VQPLSEAQLFSRHVTNHSLILGVPLTLQPVTVTKAICSLFSEAFKGGAVEVGLPIFSATPHHSASLLSGIKEAPPLIQGQNLRARAHCLGLDVSPFLCEINSLLSLYWSMIFCHMLFRSLVICTNFFHRLARWLSTFLAAWLSLKLLQSKDSDAFIDCVSYDTPTGRVVRPKRWAGRTMDLSLFAVTRALDVIIGELWSQRKASRTASGKWSKVQSPDTLSQMWLTF